VIEPASWRRSRAGGDVVLTHRHEPDSGWIRVSAGITPLKPAADLVAAPRDIGVTDEGEYFVIGSAKDRVRAVVFGAESYTQIDACVLDPNQRAAYLTMTRALAHETTLGHGTGRIRPYYYEAPIGWSPLPRAGSTLWVSPTCARRYQVLRMFEAYPADQEASVRRRRFQSVSLEVTEGPPAGPAVYYTKDDLEVRVYAYRGSIAGRPLRVLDAAVIDTHHCYPLSIECDPTLLEDAMRVVEDVVRTIVPLPASALTEPQNAYAMSHWSE
jgi:hypothetical protein